MFEARFEGGPIADQTRKFPDGAGHFEIPDGANYHQYRRVRRTSRYQYFGVREVAHA